MFGGKPSKNVLRFERFALKQSCVSWHVSSSFTWSLFMNFMRKVLNSYKNTFGLELSG